MRLRNIEFEPCWDGAGARGFMDERYWHHRIPPLSTWLSFNGSTRVGKTTTLPARIPPNGGTMPIGNRFPWQPLEWFPRCIWFDVLKGRTLNGVGLSGPGALELFYYGLLFALNETFFISFMSVAESTELRLEEFRRFVGMILTFLDTKVRFGLQINFSCANAGMDPAYLIFEVLRALDEARPLVQKGIPIVVKLNVLAPIEAVQKIASHPNCDAICVSNAIPFGTLPERIDWKRIFPGGSPLKLRNKTYGEGGYSGPELLPLVAEFIREAKKVGVKKPWNAGGGIRSARDVQFLVREAGLERGRDSIFFASAAMVRPWNVRSIIKAAHQLLG